MELGSNGRYSGHSHCRLCYMHPLSASSDEVAPLTEEECRVLDAIDSPDDRYTVYSTPGKLAWGVGLKVGDTVLARLPPQVISREVQQDIYTAAIIRLHGNVGFNGYLFGVEITVSVHCHQRNNYAVESVTTQSPCKMGEGCLNLGRLNFFIHTSSTSNYCQVSTFHSF